MKLLVKKVVSGIFLILMLGACAQLQRLSVPDEAWISDLIEQQQYSKVEQLLEQGAGPHVDEQWRRDRLALVKELIWTQEREYIRSAVQAENQRDWRTAQRTFLNGLRHLPNSQIMRAAYQQYKQRRQVHEEVLQAELLITEGERLMKDARTYEKLIDIKSSSIIQRWRAMNVNLTRKRVAKKLSRHSQLAVQRTDYTLARRCLSLANRLHSTPATVLALNDLNQYIKPLTPKARKLSPRKAVVAKAAAPSNTFDSQLLALKSRLAAGELLQVQQQLTRLQRAYPSNIELDVLSAELKTAIDAKVINDTERGKVLYSQGRVELALTVWRDVLPLAPNNTELKSKIARAERLLQNIKHLNQKQSG